MNPKQAAKILSTPSQLNKPKTVLNAKIINNTISASRGYFHENTRNSFGKQLLKNPTASKHPLNNLNLNLNVSKQKSRIIGSETSFKSAYNNMTYVKPNQFLPIFTDTFKKYKYTYSSIIFNRK